VISYKKKIMIIAGEASGDLHGAHLVRAMIGLNPGLEFFGIGGNALRQAGVRIRIDNSEMAVVGISEAFSKINLLLRALKLAKHGPETGYPCDVLYQSPGVGVAHR